VAYLRTHGAAQVIFGQVLFRSKKCLGGPSLEEFRARVEEVNSKMREWMGKESLKRIRRSLEADAHQCPRKHQPKSAVVAQLSDGKENVW